MKKALFVIYAADQKISRDFFARVLDQEPVLDVPGMTEFSLINGASLGIMPEAGIQRLLAGNLPEPAFTRGHLRAEIYLCVDNPEDCLKRAVEAGARLLSQCENRDWGDVAGYCLDRDGYVLGFGKKAED